MRNIQFIIICLLFVQPQFTLLARQEHNYQFNVKHMSHAEAISFLEALLLGTFDHQNQQQLIYKQYNDSSRTYAHSGPELKLIFNKMIEACKAMQAFLTELEEKRYFGKLTKLEDLSEFDKLDWQLERFATFLFNEDLKRLPSKGKEPLVKARNAVIKAFESGDILAIKSAAQKRLHSESLLPLLQEINIFLQAK